jgi:hypothetical protein
MFVFSPLEGFVPHLYVVTGTNGFSQNCLCKGETNLPGIKTMRAATKFKTFRILLKN